MSIPYIPCILLICKLDSKLLGWSHDPIPLDIVRRIDQDPVLYCPNQQTAAERPFFLSFAVRLSGAWKQSRN
jgi:hypothetical protein